MPEPDAPYKPAPVSVTVAYKDGRTQTFGAVDLEVNKGMVHIILHESETQRDAILINLDAVAYVNYRATFSKEES